MDALNQLRRLTVTIFNVSPFYLIACVIWVSLLGDYGGTGNFATHYKSLLAAYPFLGIASRLFIYGFSLLLAVIFISMLLVFYAILQNGTRARWLKPALPTLFIIAAAAFIALVFLYTPPDVYIVMIFLVILTVMYTQLGRFNRLEISRLFLRRLSIPTALAGLLMLAEFLLALAWLVIFAIDSGRLAQPWLAQSTLIFMIVSTLVMGLTTYWTSFELLRSLPIFEDLANDTNPVG